MPRALYLVPDATCLMPYSYASSLIPRGSPEPCVTSFQHFNHVTRKTAPGIAHSVTLSRDVALAPI